MSNQIKLMEGFAVLTKGTKTSFWRLFRHAPISNILRLNQVTGSKTIAVIKVYLK